MRDGERWSRDELLVAMNIYEKLPFGLFHQGNPVLIDIAQKLSRTPASLAMKLGNLASLDPALHARGRKGLPGASRLDREVWNEFQSDPEVAGVASEEAFRQLFGANEADNVEMVKGSGVRISHAPANPAPSVVGTEAQALVKVRRGQQFFRQMVLNAYDARCCVTGITVRELLIASHIKPWGEFPENRLQVGNGLCLSRLHDGAFDQGLITFDQDLCLLLSGELRAHLPQTTLEQNFVAFVGNAILLPEKSTGPDPAYLHYHQTNIFRG